MKSGVLYPLELTISRPVSLLLVVYVTGEVKGAAPSILSGIEFSSCKVLGNSLRMGPNVVGIIYTGIILGFLSHYMSLLFCSFSEHDTGANGQCLGASEGG